MIKLPAYFMGFNSKADGSAGLRFATQELAGEDFANLKDNQGAFGWMIFSPNEHEEMPEDDAPEDTLSPSEILFKRMFRYFKEKVEKQNPTADFNTWRRQQLERIGQNYLDKLA